MGDYISKQEVLDTIHKEIYNFFPTSGDDEWIPMNEEDKLLLDVNKKICNAINNLESTTFDKKAEIVIRQLREDRDNLLNAIKEIKKDIETLDWNGDCAFFDGVEAVSYLIWKHTKDWKEWL